MGWAVLMLLTHYLAFLMLLHSAENSAGVDVIALQQPYLNDCASLLLKPEPAMPVLGCWPSSLPHLGLMGSPRGSKTCAFFLKGLIVILNLFVESAPHPCKVGVIIPIFQVRRLRIREVKQFVQGHRAVFVQGSRVGLHTLFCLFSSTFNQYSLWVSALIRLSY